MIESDSGVATAFVIPVIRPKLLASLRDWGFSSFRVNYPLEVCPILKIAVF